MTNSNMFYNKFFWVVIFYFVGTNLWSIIYTFYYALKYNLEENAWLLIVIISYYDFKTETFKIYIVSSQNVKLKIN